MTRQRRNTSLPRRCKRGARRRSGICGTWSSACCEDNENVVCPSGSTIESSTRDRVASAMLECAKQYSSVEAVQLLAYVHTLPTPLATILLVYSGLVWQGSARRLTTARRCDLAREEGRERTLWGHLGRLDTPRLPHQRLDDGIKTRADGEHEAKSTLGLWPQQRRSSPTTGPPNGQPPTLRSSRSGQFWHQ